MLKKIFAIFLLALMVLSVSCTNNSGPTVPPDNDGIDSIINYMTFRWGTSREDYNPVEGKTTTGDEILARYNELRTKYHMEFIVEDVDADYDTIAKRYASGRDYFDMFFGSLRKIGIYSYEAGFLYALEDIPNIDPNDEKWGIKNSISYGIFGGKQYGFFPNSWGIIPDFEGALLFNEDLIDYYRVTSPYELQEQGTWNWSNFTTMLQTIKNSGIECSPWGHSSLHESVIYAFHSNGLRGLTKNISGEYEYGFASEAGIETLEWLADLGLRGLFAVSTLEKSGEEFKDKKQMVFFTAGSRDATTVSDQFATSKSAVSAITNLGFIMYPYGPSGNRESCSATTEYTRQLNFLMNMSENSPEQIGAVIDILFDSLSDHEDSHWQYRAKEWIFSSEKGYNNFIWMLEHCNYDFSAYYPESYDMMDRYYDQICRGQASASTVFDQVRASIKSEIAKRVALLGEPVLN